MQQSHFKLGINKISTNLSPSSTLSRPIPIWSINLSLRLKLPLNRALNRLRLRSARPPALHVAVLANQEFLKVPLDALQAHEAGLLLLHPLPNGLGRLAVDLSLAEDLVGDFVADDAEVLDFLVGARVLAVELVAGEGEDFEVVGVGGFDVWWEEVSFRRRRVGGEMDVWSAHLCREPQGRRAGV